jgi:hypothetical protein
MIGAGEGSVRTDIMRSDLVGSTATFLLLLAVLVSLAVGTLFAAASPLPRQSGGGATATDGISLRQSINTRNLGSVVTPARSVDPADDDRYVETLVRIIGNNPAAVTASVPHKRPQHSKQR